MNFNINPERLKCINKLIKCRQTGKPEKFAGKLNISIATLYRYLRFIKLNGAPVKYDKFSETYYYNRPGDMKIHFDEKSDV